MWKSDILLFCMCAQVHDSFYSDVITLVVEGKEVAVKVQAMQRHPFKPKLVHIDFKRA